MEITQTLYSIEDSKRTSKALKKTLIPLALLLAVTIALTVFALVYRYRALSVVALIVGAWLCYFVFINYAMPWIRYYRFLQNMERGLSRKTDAWFVSLSDSTRTVDGVDIFDFLVRVGDQEEDERLFYWDSDKARPNLVVDQKLHIVSFSNFVKELCVVDS